MNNWHPALSPGAGVGVVVNALLLRKARPDLPALEVLDHAMRGRYGHRIDFGDLATPPAPFGLLVVEALDGGMPRGDWEGLWRCNSHNEVRPFLLRVFVDEVWPRFRVRYSCSSRKTSQRWPGPGPEQTTTAALNPRDPRAGRAAA